MVTLGVRVRVRVSVRVGTAFVFTLVPGQECTKVCGSGQELRYV